MTQGSELQDMILTMTLNFLSFSECLIPLRGHIPEATHTIQSEITFYEYLLIYVQLLGHQIHGRNRL